MQRSIWIGFDRREAAAFAVCRDSILAHLSAPIPIRGIVLSELQESGLYRRETERRLGRLYDKLSVRGDYDGAMSTEFAIARFLVKELAGDGLALFMDCDMLVRTDLCELFQHCEENSGKAVYCVKHDHRPASDRKMDDQVQTSYARKNWSSLVMWDCDHPANMALTLDLVNTAPGRDLHAFCWLADQDIGELGPEWNWLVGHSNGSAEPKVVHWTDGGPWFEGFRDVPFADEYDAVQARWASGQLSFGA